MKMRKISLGRSGAVKAGLVWSQCDTWSPSELGAVLRKELSCPQGDAAGNGPQTGHQN